MGTRTEALAAVAPTAPVVSRQQRELIKRTIAIGASDEELELFFYDCERRGLHPLDRQIHFTKRDGRYVPIVSIDLLRSRAHATGEVAGSDDAVFTDDGCDSGVRALVAASVTVYRLTQGQRFAYTATARWTEYCPAPGPRGNADRMWQKMPHTMLAKCAEALALRKAFPQELSGLYAVEELDQADREMPAGRRAAPREPAVIDPPVGAAPPDVMESDLPPKRAAAGTARIVYIVGVSTTKTKRPGLLKYTIRVQGDPSYPANETTISTINQKWGALAEECHQHGAAVKISTKRTDFGLDLASFERVDDQGNVLPLTSDDIPFR